MGKIWGIGEAKSAISRSRGLIFSSILISAIFVSNFLFFVWSLAILDFSFNVDKNCSVGQKADFMSEN